MLPILPLLLILLFPGSPGRQAGAWNEPGASVERRMIAALVQSVRQEAEREALASSAVPRPALATIAAPVERDPETTVPRSDRVRDGPRG